jgi:ubiquinone/menaquinone biosynthesis C-methylase UbiE
LILDEQIRVICVYPFHLWLLFLIFAYHPSYMDHRDHVSLLRPANLPPGGTWADFGAGGGAFTLALRELVGAEAHIYAIDKERGSLRELEREYRSRFGDTANLHIIAADFSRPVELPPLDGALMANSLHYVSHKVKLLQQLRGSLKPGGALLLVEYNVDAGNMWVPYPLSFETWRKLAPQAGFTEPRLLATRPSRFLREFYSAIAYRVD